MLVGWWRRSKGQIMWQSRRWHVSSMLYVHMSLLSSQRTFIRLFIQGWVLVLPCLEGCPKHYISHLAKMNKSKFSHAYRVVHSRVNKWYCRVFSELAFVLFRRWIYSKLSLILWGDSFAWKVQFFFGWWNLISHRVVSQFSSESLAKFLSLYISLSGDILYSIEWWANAVLYP